MIELRKWLESNEGKWLILPTPLWEVIYPQLSPWYRDHIDYHLRIEYIDSDRVKIALEYLPF